MNVKEWAQTLNGREYMRELVGDEEIRARDDNVVIVFGASDDLIEFSGVVSQDDGAWDGTTVKITPSFKLFNEETNAETFEFNRKEIDAMPEVAAIWSPKEPEASWLITSKIPHETFDIMEDGALYCRGIVFDAKYLGKV